MVRSEGGRVDTEEDEERRSTVGLEPLPEGKVRRSSHAASKLNQTEEHLTSSYRWRYEGTGEAVAMHGTNRIITFHFSPLWITMEIASSLTQRLNRGLAYNCWCLTLNSSWMWSNSQCSVLVLLFSNRCPGNLPLTSRLDALKGQHENKVLHTPYLYTIGILLKVWNSFEYIGRACFCDFLHLSSCVLGC